MNIAIIGAGAIGSIIAGFLTKAGEDVLLVARKEHVAAINKKGLRVKCADGEETIPVRAKTKLDKEYDLVIFATKSQDLEYAFQENHPFLENCYVLMTQNGVQGENLLSCHFDPEKVIGSIVMFGATYTKPGEVTFNFPGDWILGKPYTANDPKLEEFAEIFKKAFPVILTTNIMGMKWLKLFVNFNNCIPALLGKSMQETFADQDFCKLSIRLLKEGLGIVQDAGIELLSLPGFPVERIFNLVGMPEHEAAEIIRKTLTTLSKEPLYGSVLQSIMRGKTSEIDFINGEVAQLARSMQGRAVLNEKVIDLVHRVEQSGKFFEPAFIKKEFNL